MESIWQIFVHETGWVAKAVLVILLIFSIVSFAIILAKYLTLKRVKRQNALFRRRFLKAARINDAKEIAREYDYATTASLFSHAYSELNAQSEGTIRWSLVEREIQRQHRRTLRGLRKGLPFLATTAGATPFIGLFGTVWGIMNAFRQIGLVGSSSLATVAPGISEALINTAAGLFAAIPALIAYNLFTQALRGIGEENEDFSDQLLILLQKRIPGPTMVAGPHGGSDDQ